MASIDQSKLSTLGQTHSQKLNVGSRKYVNVLVTRLSESDAGLSAGANSGGVFAMKYKRKATIEIPHRTSHDKPSRKPWYFF
jgi:hypothetical protein